jgi:hypothetical protein
MITLLLLLAAFLAIVASIGWTMYLWENQNY